MRNSRAPEIPAVVYARAEIEAPVRGNAGGTVDRFTRPGQRPLANTTARYV